MMPRKLLADANLWRITFRGGSSEVVLDFLNMADGGAVGSLVCSGLVAFTYQAMRGIGLPQYVGEVNHALVPSAEAPALLQRLRFGFGDSHAGSSDPDVAQIHHVRIHGWAEIEIVCADVRLVP